jgi:hypothetical protein
VFVPSHGGLHEWRSHTGEHRDIRMLVPGVAIVLNVRRDVLERVTVDSCAEIAIARGVK